MRAGLREEVQRYLGQHQVMTLASQGEEGVWAAAVFYTNEGFAFYFLSSPSSRHGRNLAANPRAAATIHADYADWREIKGVQMEGKVCLLAGKEEAEARGLYGAKFPIVANAGQAPASIIKALARVRWYRFVPERLYFIDNSAGFGQREEIELRTGGA
ncbi:MAG: pyridoxamine 5'-phosphate oxidase family protein [Burkholderiales bacterium]|nr:pyridoxamine 5'-phosphate oxidase family protein [Burkholderiales bacterium]